MADNKVLRCGPAGWCYPHWEGVVYPRPKPRGFHPLEFLSRYFDAVEINTSFYGAIRPEIAKLWAACVAGNTRFTFTAKLHRGFTHERSLDAGEAEHFSRGLRPLREAGRFGCLLMQFPWSFRFTDENRGFLIRLRRLFSEFPLAVEMRHGSWMREEALGMLVDYRLGFCNIDQPEHAAAMPPTAWLTSSTGYVRLHGRNYGDWFRKFEEPRSGGARHDYLYSMAELEEWKNRIEHIRRYADSVYVITNNDIGGRAVVNALQLQAMLGQRPSRAPGQLARLYRRELDAYPADAPLQEVLFAA
ncbi:MAG: DUF72 domain-containing protein [Bryobacteraceae bacterium]|nr:DUF72 domain-containing protein [Bryobacteraceae bacterium]